MYVQYLQYIHTPPKYSVLHSFIRIYCIVHTYKPNVLYSERPPLSLFIYSNSSFLVKLNYFA